VADAGDYDADGKTDLLWRHPPTGRHLLCRSDGVNTTRCSDYATLPAGWSLVGLGDTNGDGLRDVILRGAGGSLHLVCLGQGTTLGACGASFGNYDDTTWRLVAPGDVDGDQRADLVLHHVPSGIVLACPVVGLTVSACNPLITLGAGYTVIGIGDATGDGSGDLALRDATGATLLVCSLANARLLACAGLTGIPARWQLVGAGDYDGDRRADLVLRDAAAGLVRVDFLSGLARKGNPLILPAGPNLRVYARH
jgi:hypothetical protein